MQDAKLHKVTLGSARLHRVAFNDSDRNGGDEPWADVANLLTEKRGFFLLENGGALLLENKVKQISLNT